MVVMTKAMTRSTGCDVVWIGAHTRLDSEDFIQPFSGCWVAWLSYTRCRDTHCRIKLIISVILLTMFKITVAYSERIGERNRKNETKSKLRSCQKSCVSADYVNKQQNIGIYLSRYNKNTTTYYQILRLRWNNCINVGFVCSDMSPVFHPPYQLHQYMYTSCAARDGAALPQVRIGNDLVVALVTPGSTTSALTSMPRLWMLYYTPSSR